jgi:hypothetical protein
MIKTVQARRLSNLAMANGYEKLYTIVIDNNVVKEWVGIGWIELRKATTKDLNKYPIVERS